LIEAVFQLLFRFEGIITEAQIRQALGISSEQDEDGLCELLKSDKRFIDCSNQTWKCAPLESLTEDMPIRDIDFVITDIETTGSIRGKDRIIEIAAIKVRNGEILSTFESMVNPDITISRQISRLTKISNSTVKDAPYIEEVLPQYVDFVGNGIFVAHNSLFDFPFINSEIRRLQIDELKYQADICTYRIAKKLLPHVRARGISGLSSYFDYHMENRHRAMPDVLAAHFFLNKFLDTLDESKIDTLHKLVNFQKDKLSKKELLKRMKRQRKKNFMTSAIA